MINYSNQIRFDNKEFSEYLSIEGYSHSYLKSHIGTLTPQFNVTDKVRIGKIVDQILTNQEIDFASNLYPVASRISKEIKNKFGSLIKHFDTQVAFTGIAEHSGLKMKVKGILDYLLPGNAVLDLKVTFEKDIMALIKYMGYENQLWNYAKLAKVDKAFIVIHSVPTKETKIISIDVSSNHNQKWADWILDFGTV